MAKTAPVVPAAVADGVALTPGRKAWLTRQARISRGDATPTDWAAAGRKAWETRQRNEAARAAA
jgi:hypothetical protein